MMRSTHVCPKCQHRRVLHITQIADHVGDLGGIRLADGTNPEPSAGQAMPWRIARVPNPEKSIWKSEVMTAGLVEAFVCRGCGYTELYTRDPAEIPVDGVIVREVTPEG